MLLPVAAATEPAFVRRRIAITVLQHKTHNYSYVSIVDIIIYV